VSWAINLCIERTSSGAMPSDVGPPFKALELGPCSPALTEKGRRRQGPCNPATLSKKWGNAGKHSADEQTATNDPEQPESHNRSRPELYCP
jgi:hypothetical protein